MLEGHESTMVVAGRSFLSPSGKKNSNYKTSDYNQKVRVCFILHAASVSWWLMRQIKTYLNIWQVSWKNMF